MQDDTKVQAIFRKLHEESVHKYEAEQVRNLKHAELLAINHLESAKDISKIFPDLRIDQSALKLAGERENSRRDERIKATSKEFGNRARKTSRDFRNSLHASDTARLAVPLFAAGLMADDHAQFAQVDGERGNPWILPYDPSEINVKVHSTGMGDYLFLPGGVTFQTEQTSQIDLWFLFWPDTSGMWNLTGLADLFGYYYLRSNDEWYNSKWAKARVGVLAGVYQYFWSGVKQFVVFDRDEDNIDNAYIVDDFGWFDTQAFLRAGDPAIFLLSIGMTAHAQGDGSYAEINFSDGSANYIKPLLLLASPA